MSNLDPLVLILCSVNSQYPVHSLHSTLAASAALPPPPPRHARDSWQMFGSKHVSRKAPVLPPV